MKKIFLCLLILISVKVLNAQDNYDDNNNDDKTKDLKKKMYFSAEVFHLGFGSGSFGVGANPEIGYSFSQWLDGGVVFNVNYNSQSYMLQMLTGCQICW